MVTTSRPTRGLDIPDDLVSGIYERRVIPFVGAGFSNGLGMPDWEQLLRKLSAEVEPDLTFEKIKAFTNGDFLQIAEYLYIKSDKRIGPLRHVIQGLLGGANDPVLSAGHVELVNLGAPQIYTTNYDDLIERTYKSLGVPASVVALPKDVANSSLEKTQIVKYHGDLRHEGTLVLTESAYYKRLDLESPMDLKFRSDILGRSVLFMGYSFRDVNIRLIWFKLMQMMQDIPPDDRRASYILKIGPNPVQDALFRDVGLTPTTLDPDGRYKVSDRSKLLAEFLDRLAFRAGQNTIPGTINRMFASSNLIASLPKPKEDRDRYSYFMRASETSSVHRFLHRDIPPLLIDSAAEAFKGIYSSSDVTPKNFAVLVEKIKLFGACSELTEWACSVLRGGSDEAHRTRELLTRNSDVPWDLVWASKVSEKFAKEMIDALSKEVDWNSRDHADFDIAYAANIVQRLIGGLVDGDPDILIEGVSQVKRAAAIYPLILSQGTDEDKAPQLDATLQVIRERMEQLAEASPVGRSDAELYASLEELRRLEEELIESEEN